MSAAAVRSHSLLYSDRTAPAAPPAPPRPASGDRQAAPQSVCYSFTAVGGTRSAGCASQETELVAGQDPLSPPAWPQHL